jgi:hypothetical protein
MAQLFLKPPRHPLMAGYRSAAAVACENDRSAERPNARGVAGERAR